MGAGTQAHAPIYYSPTDWFLVELLEGGAFLLPGH